ncbi:MAG: hypothetical protein P0Y53_01045 [Candidatus Pseudobacter hemicellulosilyticus]|uniref:Tetratricopeptide repeat protein n=1 Tax=Candidatus Pseudobacter hemicellulosilyticus TaxID=3121375 RepID=A0AAJ5WUY2_9BACT|nr:MAG: hypothetical protein P0Y53_01045 [Pseudobacter sp.]
MNRIFLLVLFLTAAIHQGRAQQYNIRSLIDAWKDADTGQSARAQCFYDTLHRKKDTARYQELAYQFREYLVHQPDKRLEARFILYQTLGRLEFGYPITDSTLLHMQKAIRLASELGDDQLMAEIYSVYGGIGGPENYLLYNLKALELQRRVGLQHFFFVFTRFFDISRALYLNQEYRQSIAYGLECLKAPITDHDHAEPLVYMFQLDILGASYKKLGLYDSAAYYYKEMLQQVEEAIPDNPAKQQLWESIGKGNLGHILHLQQQDAAAWPLLNTYLQASLSYGDQLNMAMANNFLAQLHFRQHQFPAALDHWHKAYKASLQAGSLENAAQATEGLATIFRQTRQTDSAFFYYTLHHQHKDSLAAGLRQLQLSNMQARIAFDDLQSGLQQSQLALQQVRTTRNAIMAGIAVLTLLILLLYNRRRIRQRYALQLMQQQQETARQEILHARRQIAGFKDHIIEKNNLIETLEGQLNDMGQQQSQQAITESLQQYTLLTDEEWHQFKIEFARAYPDFLTRLRTLNPQISPAEERLATLIFLQFSTDQIASTLGIGRESVLRSKRRLKQRLQLPETTTIEEYLFNLLDTNS